jgi:hypothetical protein
MASPARGPAASSHRQPYNVAPAACARARPVTRRPLARPLLAPPPPPNRRQHDLIPGGGKPPGPAGMLTVRLVRIQGLRSEDLIGQSDPYVVVQVRRRWVREGAAGPPGGIKPWTWWD